MASSLVSHVEQQSPPANDAISQKLQATLLSNIKEHRPSSTHSNISIREGSKQSNRSTSSNSQITYAATQKKSVSQLSEPFDKEKNDYLVRLNYHRAIHNFDQQTTEKIIASRIGREDNLSDSKIKFSNYPDYKQNFHPKLLFEHKKIEYNIQQSGQKYLEKQNYDAFLGKMQPIKRAEKTDINYTESILTKELHECSVDIAVKIEELKLKEEGYSSDYIKNMLQKGQSAPKEETPVFEKISEKIQYEEEQQYQNIINKEQLLEEPFSKTERGKAKLTNKWLGPEQPSGEKLT